MTEQGTLEWKMERLGHITASRISDVMAKGRGNAPSLTREKYKWEIITQRLTNELTEGYENEAMKWGIITEPQARMAYEVSRGTFVERVGFIKHPTIKWIGASPDGLIHTDGCLEIKCPNSSTHLQTLKAQTSPSQYYGQMQMQMWVTERKWCDFVSYDPRLPDDLMFYCIRVNRDEDFIAEMNFASNDFLNEVEQEIEILRRKNA